MWKSIVIHSFIARRRFGLPCLVEDRLSVVIQCLGKVTQAVETIKAKRIANQLYDWLGTCSKPARLNDEYSRSIRVLLDHADVLSEHLTPPITSIQRGRIENQRILDIIPRVTHHGNGRVLSSWKFVVPNELDSLGLDHGFLRIDHEVE